ncbi:chymotrypsin-like elastase family member 1 [Argopecten irradians]|uniref:chymotrypsin-like elastase family member 1 n=1 Tax=Argopecten irradians TaxID=31199 RepID=UPI00371595B6
MTCLWERWWEGRGKLINMGRDTNWQHFRDDMDSRLVLLALAIFGVVTGAKLQGEDEGTDPGTPPNIVGGTDADEDAWPWQVTLTYKNQFMCGGTILNEKTILTAAHCTYRAKKRALKVIVGNYDRRKNEKKTRGEKKMKVASIIQVKQSSNIKHVESVLCV